VGEVVGAVSDGRAAVSESRRLKPDVAVLDLAMPWGGGIETAKIIRQDLPDIKVIICTVHANKEQVAQAFAAGAVGFVRKQSAYEDLAPAIRAALAGERFVSPSVCRNGPSAQEAKAEN
jgi:DNA-binding NarL/FixJ family response regulator